MKNKNLIRVGFAVETAKDGVLLSVPVDQFPVSNKGLLKDDGFPMSDIGILDRFSLQSNVDEDFVKMVAKRLSRIDVELAEHKSDLTLAEEIRALRPAWCQTASEYAAYSERVYTELSDMRAVELKKTPSTTTTEEKVETSAPADGSPAPAVSE